MDLSRFVTEKQQTGLLLIGSKGLSMRKDALALARHLLSTSTVENHTDFLLVEPQDGKKSIGVEDIAPVIQKGTFPPVHGNVSVVVIDGMEKVTIVAQNKLLVLLESNPYVFVVAIAYDDAVLDTVKSRMRVIPYRNCTKEEFVSASELSPQDAELFYYATSGCPGMLDTLLSEKEMFLSLRQICNEDSERFQMFRLLRLVLEKDKCAVTTDVQLMLCIIRVLQYIFKERATDCCNGGDVLAANRYLDIVERLFSDEQRCGSSSYSKDDFFNMIVYCVEH